MGMGDARYYLKYHCHDGHEPVEWSSVRSDRMTESCPKCGHETKPHIISEQE